MYTYEDAIPILINKFPEMKTIYEEDSDYYEDIPYVFYESEFESFILKCSKNNDGERLEEIFEFVESLLSSGDEIIVNLVEVSIIESLYFERAISNEKLLISYFGPLTLESYEMCRQQVF